MPIPWLEKPENKSASLSTRLASDCHALNGLTTSYISVLLQAITSLIAGIIIAFYY